MILINFHKGVRIDNKVVSYVQVEKTQYKIKDNLVSIKINNSTTLIPLNNVEYIFIPEEDDNK